MSMSIATHVTVDGIIVPPPLPGPPASMLTCASCFGVPVVRGCPDWMFRNIDAGGKG